MRGDSNHQSAYRDRVVRTTDRVMNKADRVVRTTDKVMYITDRAMRTTDRVNIYNRQSSAYN